MAKPICNKRVSHDGFAKIMHTAVALRDSGAVVNLIHPALITFRWRNRDKKEVLPKLRTAKTQPPRVEGLNTLHVRFSDLCTRVWIGTASQVVIDMPLGTARINGFICVIFPSERKVESWHLPPVPTLKIIEPDCKVKNIYRIFTKIPRYLKAR